MTMASQGQILRQRVHPVQTSGWTSQTTRPVGRVMSWDTFTMQVSWGATAMQASQPVQRSAEMFAMVRDLRMGVAMGRECTPSNGRLSIYS